MSFVDQTEWSRLTRCGSLMIKITAPFYFIFIPLFSAKQPIKNDIEQFVLMKQMQPSWEGVSGPLENRPVWTQPAALKQLFKEESSSWENEPPSLTSLYCQRLSEVEVESLTAETCRTHWSTACTALHLFKAAAGERKTRTLWSSTLGCKNYNQSLNITSVFTSEELRASNTCWIWPLTHTDAASLSLYVAGWCRVQVKYHCQDQDGRESQSLSIRLPLIPSPTVCPSLSLPPSLPHLALHTIQAACQHQSGVKVNPIRLVRVLAALGGVFLWETEAANWFDSKLPETGRIISIGAVMVGL